MTDSHAPELPGLDCGTCGYRTCEELAARLTAEPGLIKRCIFLSEDRLTVSGQRENAAVSARRAGDRPSVTPPSSPCGQIATAECGGCAGPRVASTAEPTWRDSLDRDFDFYLEHFPEEPGPREIILPHNPLITREMEIRVGETLIGRPLGMSCGCPITHCGIAMEVDPRTGVIVWCVTGPLGPRQNGYKDLGYYIAEGYEGLIQQARGDVKIGMRYFFQPRMCMLQWRHSGLVNYLNRTPNGLQVRLEGLWIG